jgi:hypothetical protein
MVISRQGKLLRVGEALEVKFGGVPETDLIRFLMF